MKAGTPANMMERIRNKVIVNVVRKVGNSETFELFVGVALNKRSTLKIRMPKTAKPAGKRRWSRADIVC